MTYRERAQLLTPPELTRVRRPLPKSWLKAAGILGHKRKALGTHLKRIRSEWDNKRRTQ